MSFEHGAHDIEAHSGAAARATRREEGLEDAIAVALGNAAAVIGYGKDCFAVLPIDSQRQVLCSMLDGAFCQVTQHNPQRFRRNFQPDILS